MTPRAGHVLIAALALVVLTVPGRGNASTQTTAADSLGAMEREIFEVPAGTRPLFLAHRFVEAGTFRLRVNGSLWEPGVDYRLRPRRGIVVPLRAWPVSARAMTALVVATYRALPTGLAPRIELRPLAQPPTQPGSDEIEDESVATGNPLAELEDLGTLSVRGSKSVHVASGNRRELTVDQNLRLSIAGQLTRDISVRAELSDDNLPVVPEGNTEELRDIDKVLVELAAPRWNASLGDFVALSEGTLFGNYRRKLQGFTVEARPPNTSASVLAGSPRGLYRTIEIRGEETNQGPYFLGVGEPGTNLFIVAGSERVTLDGELVVRGGDRDYVIDYIRGSVTFTYRRLITAESLIVVEFEEGEGPYGRTVVGVGGGAEGRLPVAGGLAASLGVRLTREKDDPSRLRTGGLGEDDERILAEAGDNPLAALAEGAVQVEPGQGDYVRQDSIYVFQPLGDYQVSFVYVGSGNGDYAIERLSEIGTRVYVHVGDGEGNYRVGRLLPLPDSHRVATVAAALGDSGKAGLDAEWNVSLRDANVLSDLDSGDDRGEAGRVRLRSGRVGLAGGELGFQGEFREQGAFFESFLTTRTRFDYEAWGLSERARRPGFLDERDSELGLTGEWRTGGPQRGLLLAGNWGRLGHGPDVEARRWGATVRWNWLGGAGTHQLEQATAEDQRDPLNVTRDRTDNQVSWQVGSIVPRVWYRQEQWEDTAVVGDRTRGSRLTRRGAGLGSAAATAWSWDLAYEEGAADSLRRTTWEDARDSRTWRGQTSTPQFGGMRLVGEATVRTVERPDAADATTRLAKANLAGEWGSLGSDWSIVYSVDNSRTEVLARQVVYVGERQGNYNEVGDFVGYGLGSYNLILAGTDSLVATTAVQTDFTWRQDFGFLGRDRALGAWNATTRVGVQGRSQTDDVQGLLLMKKSVLFDDDDAVLARLVFRQDLNLLRHLRALDLRLNYEYDESMDRQFAASQERRLLRKIQGAVTWNATHVISWLLRGGHEGDRRATEAGTGLPFQDYDSATLSAEIEGSWRSEGGSRLAAAVEGLTREDAASGVAQDEVALRPSVRWRIRREWTLQGEVRVSDVTETPGPTSRPHFYPRPGRNVAATARGGWDPNRFLNFALVYTGRKDGDFRWQHELRVESTARF